MTEHLDWWCNACCIRVRPEHVTFEETHDERAGGCGSKVSRSVQRIVGCPKHPQAFSYERIVNLKTGSEVVCDCCCLCGTPVDQLDRGIVAVDHEPVTRRTILGWQRHVHAVAKSKGWHSGPPNIWKFLGNLMAEAAEAWEEARKPDFDPKRKYYRADGKPEGLGPELADQVIRAMDTAEEYGIDLEAEIAEKSAFNETRPMRHGGKLA